MSGVKIEVKGLAKTAANLKSLGTAMATVVARDSLRAGAQSIISKLRGATYTTFQRLDGMIKAGYQARVGRSAKGEILHSVIAQKQQSLKGAAFKGVRARLRRPGRKRGPTRAVAFWWRFLEYGTEPRGNVAGQRLRQKGKKTIRLRSTGKNLGSVEPRPWVGPTLAGAASGAVIATANKMRERIDEEAKKLPK